MPTSGPELAQPLFRASERAEAIDDILGLAKIVHEQIGSDMYYISRGNSEMPASLHCMNHRSGMNLFVSISPRGEILRIENEQQCVGMEPIGSLPVAQCPLSPENIRMVDEMLLALKERRCPTPMKKAV